MPWEAWAVLSVQLVAMLLLVSGLWNTSLYGSNWEVWGGVASAVLVVEVFTMRYGTPGSNSQLVAAFLIPLALNGVLIVALTTRRRPAFVTSLLTRLSQGTRERAQEYDGLLWTQQTWTAGRGRTAPFWSWPEGDLDPKLPMVWGLHQLVPSTSEELQRQAHSEQTWERRRAAKHYSTPEYLLQQLANDPQAQVRSAVAANEHTPVETLSVLAGDRDEEVRGWVAYNPQTSAADMWKLAHDNSALVRAFLAGNILSGDATLDLLAHDNDPRVRGKVARNPSTPQTTRKLLTSDPDKHVRAEARSNK